MTASAVRTAISHHSAIRYRFAPIDEIHEDAPRRYDQQPEFPGPARADGRAISRRNRDAKKSYAWSRRSILH